VIGCGQGGSSIANLGGGGSGLQMGRGSPENSVGHMFKYAVFDIKSVSDVQLHSTKIFFGGK